MLNNRLQNDGITLLKLNDLQLSTKKQVETKLADGTYKQEQILCAICQSKHFDTISEKDRYGLFFPMAICRNCGLIQANPRMNTAAYTEFYQQEYRKLYSGKSQASKFVFNNLYNNRGRSIYHLLESQNIISQKKPLFVLEVGCGAGGILKFFKDKGHIVKGIDLDATYLAYGKNEQGLDLSVSDLASCTLDRQPDVIIYSHVFEHILNPVEELDIIANVLAEGGHLYLEVPGIKNLMNSYGMDFLCYLQNAHVYNFSLRSLTHLLANNGFNIVFGNEVINSIFVRSSDTASDITSDYEDAIHYLKKVERWYRVKKSFYAMLRQLTRRIGLYKLARRIFDRLQSR